MFLSSLSIFVDVFPPRLSDKAFGADHGSPTKSEAPVKRAGPCRQLAILFQRELVNVKRNKVGTSTAGTFK